MEADATFLYRGWWTSGLPLSGPQLHGCAGLGMSAAKFSEEPKLGPGCTSVALKAKAFLWRPGSHFLSHFKDLESTYYPLLNSFLLEISEVVSVSCTDHDRYIAYSSLQNFFLVACLYWSRHILLKSFSEIFLLHSNTKKLKLNI